MAEASPSAGQGIREDEPGVAIDNGSILSVNHLGVSVADIDRATRFYGELLGLRLRGQGETDSSELSTLVGLPKTNVRWAEFFLPGGQILELLEYITPHGRPLAQRTCDPGSAHFAFRVRGVDALYERLVDAGVTVRSRPVKIEEEGAWEGYRCMYAVDPDGLTVEFLEAPSPSP